MSEDNPTTVVGFSSLFSGRKFLHAKMGQLTTVFYGEKATANVLRVCKMWPSHRLLRFLKLVKWKDKKIKYQ